MNNFLDGLDAKTMVLIEILFEQNQEQLIVEWIKFTWFVQVNLIRNVLKLGFVRKIYCKIYGVKFMNNFINMMLQFIGYAFIALPFVLGLFGRGLPLWKLRCTPILYWYSESV